MLHVALKNISYHMSNLRNAHANETQTGYYFITLSMAYYYLSMVMNGKLRKLPIISIDYFILGTYKQVTTRSRNRQRP